MALIIDSRTPNSPEISDPPRAERVGTRPLTFVMFLIVTSVFLYGITTLDFEKVKSFVSAQETVLSRPVIENNPELREIPSDAELIDARAAVFDAALLPNIEGEVITWFPVAVGQEVQIKMDDGSIATVRIIALTGQETLWEDQDAKQYVYRQPLEFDAVVLDHPLLDADVSASTDTTEHRVTGFPVDMILPPAAHTID
jgi:hypothetical protein